MQLAGLVTGPVRGDAPPAAFASGSGTSTATRALRSRAVRGLGARPLQGRPPHRGRRAATEPRLRGRSGLDDHEVPVEVRAEEERRLRLTRVPCPSWVAPPSSSRSVSPCTRSSRERPRRGSVVAAWRSPRRTPRRVVLHDARRLGGAALGARPARLLVHVRRTHDERGAPDRSDLGLLGRSGGLAPPLAPDRIRRGRRPPQPGLGAQPRRLGRPGVRGGVRLLLVPARRRREPVRDTGGPARRRGHDAEPSEPVHARAPAAPVPGLRRSHGAFFAMGALLSRRTSVGSWQRGASRSSHGPPSGSASCSAPGRTWKWAGAGTTRGTRSRTPR